jgi:hypothetical protein
MKSFVGIALATLLLAAAARVSFLAHKWKIIRQSGVIHPRFPGTNRSFRKSLPASSTGFLRRRTPWEMSGWSSGVESRRLQSPTAEAAGPQAVVAARNVIRTLRSQPNAQPIVCSVRSALRCTVAGRAVRAILSFYSLGTIRRCALERGYSTQTRGPNHQEVAQSGGPALLHLPHQT